MVADYLKFPKIVGSILFAFVAFKVSFYFDNPSKYLFVLFASSLFSSFQWFIMDNESQD
jgi:nicotinamide riboside transporter PnuC